MTFEASTAWPTASTRIVVLLGWPARHSLSPQLHNAAFRADGLDLVYLAVPTPPAAVHDVVAALGAIEVVGANVTVPHKRAVVEACDVLTDEARLVGAVNTLHWTEDGLVGDNTDARGLGEALTADLSPAPRERWVLFGTGGAARAAAVALGRLAGSVSVVGRRQAAAEEVADLAARAGATDVEVVLTGQAERLAAAAAAARTVLNATPLGMAGEALPTPFMELRPGQVAYDLVYDPAETAFLAAARTRGATAYHGLGMLVGQAAVSYERWTGRPAPRPIMLEAATVALAARQLPERP